MTLQVSDVANFCIVIPRSEYRPRGEAWEQGAEKICTLEGGLIKLRD
jgi:hypothetical protein